MENLIPFTIFGSGIAFGIIVFIFLIALFLSDLKESGTAATVSFVVLLAVVYFFGDNSFFSIFTFRNMGIYILIGFLFSIIRTYFKGKELNLEDKKYFDLKSSVFRWWFLFPISMLNWVFGHLLKDFYSFLYRKIGGIYTYIFNV